MYTHMNVFLSILIRASLRLSFILQDRISWSKHRLSDEQVKQFHADGFLLNIPVLTSQQCDAILEDIKHFTVGPTDEHF